MVDGNWHHIVMTYDKKDAKLYINGKEEAKVAFGENPTTNNAPVRLDDGIKGLLDEVHILSMALSVKDIQLMMSKGTLTSVHSNGKFNVNLGTDESNCRLTNMVQELLSVNPPIGCFILLLIHSSCLESMLLSIVHKVEVMQFSWRIELTPD